MFVLMKIPLNSRICVTFRICVLFQFVFCVQFESFIGKTSYVCFYIYNTKASSFGILNKYLILIIVNDHESECEN